MSLKEQIFELKNKGYSYQQIQKTLGCSKSTISYHLNDIQKERAYERVKKQRKLSPWLHKTEKFLQEYDGKKITYNKRGDFDRKKLKEYLASIDKCYLTGRPIDINDFNTYEFDHIKPRMLGGESSFENLGISRPEANRAKADLTIEEFIGLCKDVLINFGYTINKEK
jgi:CRISPR/Cas system Type II protein with McrA/HNH and RuvC-like nuclease domain